MSEEQPRKHKTIISELLTHNMRALHQNTTQRQHLAAIKRRAELHRELRGLNGDIDPHSMEIVL